MCIPKEQRMHTSGSLTLLFLAVLLGCVCSQDRNTLHFEKPENSPVGSFVGSVSSSSIIQSMVGADDLDKLRYSSIQGGDSSNFNVDDVSGNITFAVEVNREEACSMDPCELSFGVAVSGGSGSSFFATINVVVTVADENDNPPLFPRPEQEIHILETSPVTSKHAVLAATDLDTSPAFGIQSYSLEPSSDTFKVQVEQNIIGTPRVNLVLTKTLDRENISSYTLSLVAKDGGDPVKSGVLTVHVIVDDFNDNPPVFSKDIYAVNLTENEGPGYEVIKLSASDRDEGPNRQLVYSLSQTQPGNQGNVQDKIEVNGETGSVTLKSALNSGTYRIYVEVRDSGPVELSDQAILDLNVRDTINDKPVLNLSPVQIDDLPLGWVSEAERPMTVVAVVSVTDRDSGKNGEVSCVSNDTLFDLQKYSTGSYKLMVADDLDREKTDTHNVTVICSDQGEPSLSAIASLLIHVKDSNDNPPMFYKNGASFITTEYRHDMIENNRIGETVIIVNAFDIDAGDNGRVKFALKDAGGNFTVTSQGGVIKTLISFDREQKSSYLFYVLASDNGVPEKTGTATVIVNIIDTNDVAPVFTPSSYKFHIYENRTPDTVVGNVSVFDPDLNDGGKVTLSVRPPEGSPTENVPFRVSSDGKISSSEFFDREQISSYTFYVEAVDHGQTRHTSTAQVVVDILDVNDNAPQFAFPSDQNFSAFVNIPIETGKTILNVEVSDKDENKNSIITYTIVNTNGTGLFRIGKFTGDIIAVKDIGTTSIGPYFITVNATDQGVPVLSKSKTLYLIVQSESATSDDVIADQNVLIVACIVCFTVIISGAVLVAMCVLRRLDRQRKLQYSTSCCPGTRSDSDNGSIGDGRQQYDLATQHGKDLNQKPEEISSPYHQQQQQPQHQGQHGKNGGHGKPTPSQDFSPDTGDSGSRKGPPVGGPEMYRSDQRREISESAVQRHDDFQSTSSAETGAGDSGHGSDEELSNSLDQPPLPPAVVIDHPLAHTSTKVGSAQPWPRTLGGSTRSSASRNVIPLGEQSSSQQHLIQRPSVSSRGKNTSVRFNPNVTDINESQQKLNQQKQQQRAYPQTFQPHQQQHLTPYFNSNLNTSNSSLGTTATSGVSSMPFYQNTDGGNGGFRSNNILQSFNPNPHLTQGPPKRSRPAPPPPPPSTHPLSYVSSSSSSSLLPQDKPNKNSIRLSLIAPQRQFSHSSSMMEEGDEQSDLNTTTSGSYSVASDDVARLSSLGETRDLYV